MAHLNPGMIFAQGASGESTLMKPQKDQSKMPALGYKISAVFWTLHMHRVGLYLSETWSLLLPRCHAKHETADKMMHD